MSKNISNLSGKIGLKNNLFQKISDRSLNSTDDKGIKEGDVVKRTGAIVDKDNPEYYTNFINPVFVSIVALLNSFIKKRRADPITSRLSSRSRKCSHAL